MEFTGPQSVVTCRWDCIFLNHIEKKKPNWIESSAWRPRNRGDNNGRTLDGTAKGGRRRLIKIAA